MFFSLLAWSEGKPIREVKISSDLVGHSLDELPKESEVGQYTQPLVFDKSKSLHYRKIGGKEFAMLIDEAASPGRKVIRAVMLIPKHRFDEAVSFDCALRNETKIEPGAGLVGIVKNAEKPGDYQPISAWRLNKEMTTFEKFSPNKVLCGQYGAD